MNNSSSKKKKKPSKPGFKLKRDSLTRLWVCYREGMQGYHNTAYYSKDWHNAMSKERDENYGIQGFKQMLMKSLIGLFKHAFVYRLSDTSDTPIAVIMPDGAIISHEEFKNNNKTLSTKNQIKLRLRVIPTISRQNTENRSFGGNYRQACKKLYGFEYPTFFHDCINRETGEIDDFTGALNQMLERYKKLLQDFKIKDGNRLLVDFMELQDGSGKFVARIEPNLIISSIEPNWKKHFLTINEPQSNV